MFAGRKITLSDGTRVAAGHAADQAFRSYLKDVDAQASLDLIPVESARDRELLVDKLEHQLQVHAQRGWNYPALHAALATYREGPRLRAELAEHVLGLLNEASPDVATAREVVLEQALPQLPNRNDLASFLGAVRESLRLHAVLSPAETFEAETRALGPGSSEALRKLDAVLEDLRPGGAAQLRASDVISAFRLAAELHAQLADSPLAQQHLEGRMKAAAAVLPSSLGREPESLLRGLGRDAPVRTEILAASPASALRPSANELGARGAPLDALLVDAATNHAWGLWDELVATQLQDLPRAERLATIESTENLLGTRRLQVPPGSDWLLQVARYDGLPAQAKSELDAVAEAFRQGTGPKGTARRQAYQTAERALIAARHEPGAAGPLRQALRETLAAEYAWVTERAARQSPDAMKYGSYAADTVARLEAELSA